MDSVLQLNNSKYTSRLMQILFNDGTYAPALFDSVLGMVQDLSSLIRISVNG